MDITAIDRQLGAFRQRVDTLRLTTPDQPRRPGDRLEKALAELELAEEELQVCLEELASSLPGPAGGADESEQRLLAKAFAELPVAVFLMDTHGSIRWVNRAASDLLRFPHGYLSHHPLAGLVDLDHRSAYRAQLSKVLREDTIATLPVRIRERHGFLDVILTMRRLSAPNGQRLVAATAHPPVTDAHSSPSGTHPSPAHLPAPPERDPGTPDLLPLPSETEARLEQDLADARADVANLRAALGTRAVIGQATGMVMAHRGLTADQAFALLRRTSQHDNVRVSRLAELILADPEIIDRL
jgi:PAS domain-containing protein